MPSGKIHSQDSLFIAVGSVGFSLYNSSDLVSAVTFAFGSLTGIILSPDLDQDGLTISELSIIRRVPVLGWMFYLYWFPYAKLIRHRHWSSHFPLVGTFGRLLYLTPLFLLLAYFDVDLLHFVGFAKDFLAGLAVSDFMHWLRDVL